MVHREAQEEEKGHGDGERGEGIQPGQRPRPERGEHGEHEELAVGEVDDLHEAEDEGEAGGDEGIDEAHEETAHEALQDDFDVHLSALGGGSRSRRSDRRCRRHGGRARRWPR